MKPFDTIYRINKPSHKPLSKNPAKHWPFFYKSLQIVLSVWIVTVLAIITQPWLDYWAKSLIKSNNNPQVMGQNIVSVPEESSSSEISQFHLQNSKVDIHAPIVEGIEKENLAQGIGHHPETPWPNKVGNVVLAGSNFELDPDNPYGQVFISLRLLQNGD